MAKKKTDAQIMRERNASYGPVNEQMKTIGVIQAELFKYCMERNNGAPSREALAHLAAMNQATVKMVRSVSNRDHKDNYQDLRNFATIAEEIEK
ncbi:MAG: hypothetical protein IH886_08370 [Nitrospinae bacterium]|nr:hypothetical protein [Nitrospinota bacterium]